MQVNKSIFIKFYTFTKYFIIILRNIYIYILHTNIDMKIGKNFVNNKILSSQLLVKAGATYFYSFIGKMFFPREFYSFFYKHCQQYECFINKQASYLGCKLARVKVASFCVRMIFTFHPFFWFNKLFQISAPLLVSICFLLLTFCKTLKIIEFKVPPKVVPGSSVQLICKYDLEGDYLYQVKWYRNETEFYRFEPKLRDSLKYSIFPVKGITVNVSLYQEDNII